jgi:predicted Zn-dependent peptidase
VAGTPRRVAFPVVQHRTLDNGLRLEVIERHHHPLVELRLVVRSGSATDGDKAGLALLAGEMLKAGGALADCRAWYRAHVVPSNTTLVFVGDVTPDAAFAAAAKWFTRFPGKPAPQPNIAPPVPQTERRIHLVNRPGSAQALVLVGLLGPERPSPDWPALSVADHILGGGVSGRLFLDVRVRRSLS